MENGTHLGSAWQDSPEVPSLIKYISSNDVAGFDDMTSLTNDQCRTSESESQSPSNDVSFSSNPMLFWTLRS